MPPLGWWAFLRNKLGIVLWLSALGYRERGLHLQQPRLDAFRPSLGELLQVGVPHGLQLPARRSHVYVRLLQLGDGDQA